MSLVLDRNGATYADGTIPGTATASRGYTGGGQISGNTTNAIEGFKEVDLTRFAVSATLVQGSRGGTVDPAATIGAARQAAIGFQSSDVGYVSGGHSGTGTNYPQISALTFPSEACVTLSATQTTTRYSGTGHQSATKGYYIGGISSSALTVIDALSFATNANAVAATGLSKGRCFGAGTSSATKGYVMGGQLTGGTSTEASITGYAFASETAMSQSAVLAVGRRLQVGLNLKLHGISAGGYTTTYSTEIDGVKYATETTVNPASTLATPKGYGATVAVII